MAVMKLLFSLALCGSLFAQTFPAGAELDSVIGTAIREETDGVLKLLLDAETGQRGFIITGEDH